MTERARPVRARRSHKAEAARVLAAGLSASAMFGIVAELSANTAAPASLVLTPVTVDATTTTLAPPITIHEVVVRHLPAPTTGDGSGAAPSGGGRSPSRRSTGGSASSGSGATATPSAPAGPAAPPAAAPAPAPAPTPAPKTTPPPVTKSGGSAN